MESEFIWVDLSTFDVGKATDFYSKVFNWQASEDSSGYHICALGQDPCAGIYEMPKFFQEFQIPSFWMTCISFSDAKAVAKSS